jgi:hypothetical protein
MQLKTQKKTYSLINRNGTLRGIGLEQTLMLKNSNRNVISVGPEEWFA